MKLLILLGVLFVSATYAAGFKEGSCMSLAFDPWEITKKVSPTEYLIYSRVSKKNALLITLDKDVFSTARRFSMLDKQSYVRWIKTETGKTRSGFDTKFFILKEDPSCRK